MGQDHQFDLAIVGGHKDVPGFGDKRLADFPAFLVFYGYVLKIRILAGDASCGRAVLEKVGVNPSGFGVDELR